MPEVTAQKHQSCDLNPYLSDFKFLVLSTQKQAMAKYVSQAQKVFLLGHGFYLLPKADFWLAFLWMPINH